MRTAGVVVTGTVTTALAAPAAGSRVITVPSGAIAPEMPFIEETTTVRPGSMARARVIIHCCFCCPVPRTERAAFDRDDEANQDEDEREQDVFPALQNLCDRFAGRHELGGKDEDDDLAQEHDAIDHERARSDREEHRHVTPMLSTVGEGDHGKGANRTRGRRRRPGCARFEEAAFEVLKNSVPGPIGLINSDDSPGPSDQEAPL